MTNPVKIEKTDEIWEITLDRPKANAINAPTSRALSEAFVAFRDDDGARVAIITGGGEKFFSAGWDLKALNDGAKQCLIGSAIHYQQNMRRFRGGLKPVS